MESGSKWQFKEYDRGVQKVEISSWKYFMDLVNEQFLNYNTYVYRGHGDSLWKLEPTIDRVIKTPSSNDREELLNNFKYATRGRRGSNPSELKTDNDWWALGQHHGLFTPLLDWSESPFVALYFAITKAIELGTESCTVWALSQYSIDLNNHTIRSNDHIPTINLHKQTVKIVRPLSDENDRLVNQRGLFTRGPNNVDIENWIKTFHSGPDRGHELYQIVIPRHELEACVRYLNKMNINHSTLFPDLSGAANYCNNQVKFGSH